MMRKTRSLVSNKVFLCFCCVILLFFLGSKVVFSSSTNAKCGVQFQPVEAKGLPFKTQSEIDQYSTDEYLTYLEFRSSFPTAKELSRIRDGNYSFEPNVNFQPPLSLKTTCPWYNPSKIARTFDVAKDYSNSEFKDLIEKIIDWNAEKKKPCVVIDAGVNLGQETVLMAKKGCQVFGYEALISNYRYVYSMLAELNLLKKVMLFYGAVGNSCQDELVIAYNDNNGQLHWGKDPEKQKDRTTVVFSRRVDDDIKEDVLLFKLDIEGNEAQALLGAKNLLQCHNVPFIITEFQPGNIMSSGFKKPSELLIMMLNLGYEIFVTPCTHNLIHEVFSYNFSKTNFRCEVAYPESVGNKQLYMFDTIINRPNSVALRAIQLYDEEEVRNFISTLIAGQTPIECCMVNFLFYSAKAYERYAFN